MGSFFMLSAIIIAITGSQGQNRKSVWQHQSNVLYVSFSADGKYVVSQGADDGVRVWDYLSGEEIHRVPTKRCFCACKLIPNSKKLVFADWKGIFVSEIRGGKEPVLIHESQTLLRGNVLRRNAFITSISVCATGSVISSADETGAVKVIDMASGKVSLLQEGTPAPFLGFSCVAAVSPNGKNVAFSQKAGSVVLWNAVENKAMFTSISHGKDICSIQFTSDGTLLGIGGWDGTFRVLRCDSGKEVAVLSGHKLYCSGVFSPSGKDIITGDGEGMIRVWNIDSQKIKNQCRGPHSGIMDLACHPNGVIFASTGEEHVVRVWDLKSIGNNRK